MLKATLSIKHQGLVMPGHSAVYPILIKKRDIIANMREDTYLIASTVLCVSIGGLLGYDSSSTIESVSRTL